MAFLTVFIPSRGFGGRVHLGTFLRCPAVCSGMLGSAYLAATVNLSHISLEYALLILDCCFWTNGVYR